MMKSKANIDQQRREKGLLAPLMRAEMSFFFLCWSGFILLDTLSAVFYRGSFYIPDFTQELVQLSEGRQMMHML